MGNKIKESIYNVVAHSGIWVLSKLFPEYFGVEPLRPTDRYIEYPWVLEKISHFETNIKVLDIGCSGTMFPLLELAMGFEVYGIDKRPITHNAGINFTQTDICENTFEKNMFTIITAISTIEHIGLKGRYGDKGVYSDFTAVNEIYDILKPNGVLLMTVPFGEKYREEKFHRIYDKKRLQDLLHKFIWVYSVADSPEADYKIALIQAVK